MMIYTIITTSLSPIIKQNQALLTIPNRVFFLKLAIPYTPGTLLKSWISAVIFLGWVLWHYGFTFSYDQIHNHNG